MVKGGVVEGYFLSTYSARKLGMQTTGNAGGSHNLSFRSSNTRPDDDFEEMLRKLGTELSYRFGVTVALTLEEGAVVRWIIHDHGRMVDEYLSVPEYFGALPPGDALALRANPTVVARVTGADAAKVRASARTAERPGDLPPAEELYGQLAALLGLQP